MSEKIARSQRRTLRPKVRLGWSGFFKNRLALNSKNSNELEIHCVLKSQPSPLQTSITSDCSRHLICSCNHTDAVLQQSEILLQCRAYSKDEDTAKPWDFLAQTPCFRGFRRPERDSSSELTTTCTAPTIPLGPFDCKLNPFSIASYPKRGCQKARLQGTCIWRLQITTGGTMCRQCSTGIHSPPTH